MFLYDIPNPKCHDVITTSYNRYAYYLYVVCIGMYLPMCYVYRSVAKNYK